MALIDISKLTEMPRELLMPGAGRALKQACCPHRAASAILAKPAPRSAPVIIRPVKNSSTERKRMEESALRPAASLPAAAPREHVHTRSVVFRGYRREDGLWDIEAELTDAKTYTFNGPDRGTVSRSTGAWHGDPAHGRRQDEDQ